MQRGGFRGVPRGAQRAGFRGVRRGGFGNTRGGYGRASGQPENRLSGGFIAPQQGFTQGRFMEYQEMLDRRGFQSPCDFGSGDRGDIRNGPAFGRRGMPTNFSGPHSDRIGNQVEADGQFGPSDESGVRETAKNDVKNDVPLALDNEINTQATTTKSTPRKKKVPDNEKKAALRTIIIHLSQSEPKWQTLSEVMTSAGVDPKLTAPALGSYFALLSFHFFEVFFF